MECGERGVAPSFEVREHREPDGTLVLSIAGDLDIATSPELAERLAGAISPLWSLVLNLDALESTDSSGRDVLAAAITRARERGYDVSLRRPRDGLLTRRRRRPTGLDAILPLRSEERAPSRTRGRRFLPWVAGGRYSLRSGPADQGSR